MTWSDRKYGVGTSTFTQIRKWPAENPNCRLILFVDDSCYVVVTKYCITYVLQQSEMRLS